MTEEPSQGEVQSSNATRWSPIQLILLTPALFCATHETMRAGFLNNPLYFTKPDSKKINKSQWWWFFPHFKNSLRWTDNQKTSFETIAFSLIWFHKLTVHCILADTLHSACLKSYYLNLMVYNPWGFVHVNLTQCLSAVSTMGIGILNYSQPPLSKLAKKRLCF